MRPNAIENEGTLPIANDRLERQIRFIAEADRLKQVLRRSRLVDGSRRENTAARSWRLTLMAVVLAEHASAPVDLLRVLKMLIVHDVVEIDADDTFCYDPQGMASKEENERRAAERRFGVIPEPGGSELKALWEEFEARQTPEARFAAALDRVQPVLANYLTDGGTWREYGVTYDQVMQRLRPIADGSEVLWDYVQGLIEEAVRRGDIVK